MIVPVNLQKLLAVFNVQYSRGVDYDLGAKAALTAPPASINKIDCSGEVRYLLAQATDQKMNIRDGSWYQREWCEANLPEVPYSTVAKAGPRRLFIAFITPGVNGCGKTGHVWLIHDGRTLESHYPAGVNRRAWDYSTLRRQAHKCFELPVELPHLVLNGHLLKNSYVVQDRDGKDHWMAPEGDLAEVVGGATQTPNLITLVADYLEENRWRILKYNGKDINTKNRAYLNAVRQ